ncbi:MAG: DUF4383 domain-containing protein [Pseudomonadota bacterium]
MNAKNFALIAGIIYLVVGILGFVPGLLRDPPVNAPDLAVEAGYGYLLGLFPVNVLHNLFHIAIGVAGIVTAKSLSGSRKFAQSVAVIYGVLTIFGLIPGLRTVFGLIPLHSHDVWLHALTAIVSAYFGFRTAPRDEFVDHGTAVK